MDIRLEVITTTKARYDITEVLSSITWSGDYKQSARKLEFSIITSSLDKNIPSVDIQSGSTVIFYEKGVELFRGMVFSRSVEKNTISFLAYDDGIRLLKIKGYYNFKNKSVTSICNQICSDYSIPKGTFPEVSTKITKIFINVSLYDIIMSCYTEAAKSNGKKYMCVFDKGKVSVVEKGINKLNITFEEMNNLIDTSYSESIENMVNKVVVVDDSGNKKAHYYKQSQIDLYGLFQEVIQEAEGKDNKTEAESKYKDIERTCSLSGYGNTSCKVGYQVTVKDSNTKMLGLFYIDTDKHTWENGNYKIDLSLNFQNMMHEVEAGKEESENTSTSKSSGSSSNSSSSGSSSSSGGSSSSSGNSKASKIVSLAKSKVGNKYVWGATGPTTFDCSGFTSWLYKQVGISIPRTSSAQSKHGKAVSRSNLQAGDLLFFCSYGSKTVSHVGLYIGNGQMIHAANSKKGVRYDDVTKGYYYTQFVNARRVL